MSIYPSAGAFAASPKRGLCQPRVQEAIVSPKARYVIMSLLNLSAFKAVNGSRTLLRVRASRCVLPSTSRPNLFSGD